MIPVNRLELLRQSVDCRLHSQSRTKKRRPEWQLPFVAESVRLNASNRIFFNLQSRRSLSRKQRPVTVCVFDSSPGPIGITELDGRSESIGVENLRPARCEILVAAPDQ